MPTRLVVLARRLRMGAELYRAVLLVAFGLTPLGARFVHLIAPSGTHWQVRVAMLIIIVAGWGAPLLPSFWWLRLARRSCPALVRPRRPRRSRLRRQALAVCCLAILLADLAYLNADGGGTEAVALVLIVIGIILIGQVTVVRRIASML